MFYRSVAPLFTNLEPDRGDRIAAGLLGLFVFVVLAFYVVGLALYFN